MREDDDETKRRSSIPRSVLKTGYPLPGMVKTPGSNKSVSFPSTSKKQQDKVTTRSQAKRQHEEELADIMSMSTPSVRKFDGTNFAVWKAQMQAYLTIKECADVLKKEKPSPSKDGTIPGDWEQKNNLAKAIILLSLDDQKASLVCHLSEAKQIWLRLIEAHEMSSSASKVALQREFFDCQMKRGENVTDYVSRLQGIYSQLLQCGVGMTEDTLVGRIVSGLTQEYHIFMTNWSNSTGVQSLKELIPKLTAEEQLIRKFDKSSKDNYALMAEKSRPTFQSGQRKAPTQQSSGQSSNRPSTSQTGQQTNSSPSSQADTRKKNIRCYNCGARGHLKPDCTKPKKPKQKSEQKQAVVAEAIVAEIITAEANVVVGEREWLIDSGASQHMSSDRSTFKSFKSYDSPDTIKLAGHGELECLGVGDVELISFVEGGKVSIVLKDTLYVPLLRRKLISVGHCTSSPYNCKTVAVGDKIYIYNKQGILIVEGEKKNCVYKARVEDASSAGLSAVAMASETQTELTDDSPPETVSDSNLDLWHERCAHVNKATIVKMSKLSSVIGLEGYTFEKDGKASDRRVINCESCCLAKQARLPIPSSRRERANEVAETLHVDICGPIGTETLSGGKYLVLFKDEFSNFRILFITKTKEEVFNCIRKCVAMISSDTKGKNVRSLMSDRGSEFTSKRTQDFLEENGIVHKTSAPFTPHQNGFIERENRTIMEAVRAMLFHRKLPEVLWDEAANSAVYILNRVINKNTGAKTPYELYMNQKPRISHLRVWGSIAFMKVQEKKRSGYQRKLDPRAAKLVLVGYDRDFTYRLYEPSTGKVIITREVVFDEGKMPSVSQEPVSYQNIEQFCDIDASEHDNDDGNIASLAQTASDVDEPTTYREAVNGDKSAEWIAAMDEEFQSLIQNKTWQLGYLPKGRKAIRNKWVFKAKRVASGEISRYKARLCAKGFSQRKGIDYDETFSPVVRHDSIRLILSLVAQLDLEMCHFDVKTAFLHGELTEEIWMDQPEGYVSEPGKHCRLLKSLYGLKQASKVWNDCFTNFLKEFDLKPLVTDSCVFIGSQSGESLIIAIYVDDGLVCCNSSILLDKVIDYLKQRFEITVIDATCFVGLEISRNRSTKQLSIRQTGHIRRMVERFELEHAKSCTIPMSPTLKFTRDGVADGALSKTVDVPYCQAMGVLTYITSGSRPDIACAVAILARFCSSPKLPHWMAVKAVMKYLACTSNLAITYDGSKSDDLVAYSDADYGGCRDSRKSVSGIIVKHGGGPVVWKSSKQSTVAESTCEAEFVACSQTSSVVVWCRNFLQEVQNKSLDEPTTIYVDNQSAIKLVKNNQIHSKIKQLDIRLMAVRERVASKIISVAYVNTTENQADIMTKPLASKQFSYLRERIGMMLLITMTLISVMSDEASASFLSYRTGFNLDEEPSVLRLKINDPCSKANEIENEAKGVTKLGPSWDLTENSQMNVSFIQATKLLCNATFSLRVLPAMNSIDGCLAAGRDKRDIAALATAVGAVANVIVGVTNLIRGASDDSSYANMVSLTDRADTRLTQTLRNRETMSKETEQELRIVSDAADYHIQQIREESSQVPMLVWMSYHTIHELYAGAANLKAIRKHCLGGRLATQELGEMLEHSALMQILPEETMLVSVAVDSDNHQIEFGYRVVKRFEVSVEFLLIIIVALTGVLVLVSLLCLNIRLVRAIKPSHLTDRQDIEAGVDAAESIRRLSRIALTL